MFLWNDFLTGLQFGCFCCCVFKLASFFFFFQHLLHLIPDVVVFRSKGSVRVFLVFSETFSESSVWNAAVPAALMTLFADLRPVSFWVLIAQNLMCHASCSLVCQVPRWTLGAGGLTSWGSLHSRSGLEPCPGRSTDIWSRSGHFMFSFQICSVSPRRSRPGPGHPFCVSPDIQGDCADVSRLRSQPHPQVPWPQPSAPSLGGSWPLPCQGVVLQGQRAVGAGRLLPPSGVQPSSAPHLAS